MILPLEQQVAPLDLCRRLKELGAPQDSEFMWYAGKVTTWWAREFARDLLTAEQVSVAYDPEAVARYRAAQDTVCAAYTVAELGALLPLHVEADDESGGYWFHVWRTPGEHHGAQYVRNSRTHSRLDAIASGAGATEAEARGALLVELVERGVVTFEKAAT
jgi:hypothetical protein